MRQYLDFLRHIQTKGASKTDRTGVGTTSVFGYQMRFDLTQGFPLLTTKQIHIPSVVHELLWFLSGETNIAYLKKNNVRIWDEWADEAGDLGPVYGAQWRRWQSTHGSIDQIQAVIDEIKINPDSRRLIVSAWNVGELHKMALQPCHAFFQFYVANNQLSCHLYQRSADAFLGVPFNIASYALLTHMAAQQCHLAVGDLIWSGGDCHIYNNHIKQVALQLKRTPKVLPTLTINRKPADIFSYQFTDFQWSGYHPDAVIKAPVAV